MEIKNKEASVQLSRKTVLLVTNICGLVGWISFLFAAFLADRLKHWPRSPQPLAGKTVPFENHGVYYVTVWEYRIYMGTFIFGLAAMVIAALINLVIRMGAKRQDTSKRHE